MRRTALAPIVGMVLALACTQQPCASQEQTVVLKPTSDTPEDKAVSVSMAAFVPGGRRGGHGWAHLAIDNRSEERREVVLELVDRLTEGKRIAVRRRVAVEAKTTEQLTLPLPSLGLPMILGLDLGGPLPARVGGTLAVPYQSSAGVAVLKVGLGDAARSAWDAMGAFDAAIYRSAGVISVDCLPVQLPTSWTGLTGFDVIVIDGADAGLTPVAQALLLDYVAGGGRLVLMAPERLPRTADSRLGRGVAEPTARDGFGAVGFFPLEVDAPTAGRRRAELCAWLTAGDYDIAPWLADEIAGPVPRVLHMPVRVPGITGIPTNLFFLVTVLFVLLAGPVNHIWCQRRGRPWLVLLTVPIGGFLVAGSIVGCSLLREGLGTQGVIATASCLDQRDHWLTAVAATTVFAGTSPTELRPDASTYLFADDLLTGNPRDPSQPCLAIDAERNRIDGALVPSRRPTGLVSMTRRICRERIRFRRAADASLELLDGQGLTVLRQTDALILHDFDDRWFLMRSDGAMRPLAAAGAMRTAAHAVEQLARTTAPATGMSGPAKSTPRGTPRVASADWLQRRLLGHLQRPGSYCALVQQAPGFDDLGLQVLWSAEAHLVVGVLAAEDIIR